VLPIPLQLVSAQGAIFAFVDFRPLLVAFAAVTAGDEAGAGGDAWAAEEALGAALFDKIGLVLTPGRSCRSATRPGSRARGPGFTQWPETSASANPS
jgi:hypothetical protein